MRVLMTPRRAIGRQYQRMMKMLGVELEFTDGAMWATARAALRRNTGARGLRTLVERLLVDAMYEVPGLAEARSYLHWSPYDRVGVVNAAP